MFDLGYLGIQRDFPTVKSVLPVKKKKNTPLSSDEIKYNKNQSRLSEPPMPPKVEMEYVKELAKSFAKGQPYAKRIALTLYRDQVHNVLKNIHKHSD